MSKFNIGVAVPGLQLGEGPHWVEARQELVYVDIPGQAVHRYVPSTGKDYSIPMGKIPALRCTCISGFIYNLLD